jgi:predicted metal-dependent phosphoesterase TrpH
MSTLLAFLVLTGCDADGGDTSDTATQAVPPGIVSRVDGWLRGDLHTHTTVDGGSEDVATVIALAEYLADPEFLAAHPEYVDNHLDYLSITDHRSVEQQADPGYGSDTLILVGGEEFGSDGHAGIHGISGFVDHDPDGNGTTLAELVAAIQDTHDQGGAFSPNHPFLPSIAWPWATETHDGVEVWNAGWALMAPDNTEERVDEWEAEHGIPASATYRRAVQETGSGSAFQALAWLEAQLMRGQHKAVIGGSDRHAVLLPGFPTTYVQAATPDEMGVAQGIRDRHTFISRNPAAAQVLVALTVDGTLYGLGDAVPLAAPDTSVLVQIRVGRADGGRLRLVGGGTVDTDDALSSAELGARWLDEPVTGHDTTLETTLTVSPGDWFYPMVLEPLIAPGATEAQAEVVRRLAREAAATAEEDFVGLSNLVLELVDNDVLWNGLYCDPQAWLPDRLQCFPPDDQGLASFFLPDLLDRGLNAVTEDGVLSDWCMGAIGSPVRFVAAD